MSGLKRIGSQAAQNLSNYNGKTHALSVVDYAGNGSAPSEQQACMNRNFKLTFKNESETAKTVIVIGGFEGLSNDSGYLEGVLTLTGISGDIVAASDGVLNLGTEEDPVNFTVDSERFDLSSLLRYLTNNPSRLMSARISARNTTSPFAVNQEQFRTTITHNVLNPFRAKKDIKEINLYQHFSKMQNQDGIVDVQDGFVWGPNGVVTWKILPETEVSIDLQFGPVLNTERGLEKLVKETGLDVRRVEY